MSECEEARQELRDCVGRLVGTVDQQRALIGDLVAALQEMVDEVEHENNERPVTVGDAWLKQARAVIERANTCGEHT